MLQNEVPTSHAIPTTKRHPHTWEENRKRHKTIAPLESSCIVTQISQRTGLSPFLVILILRLLTVLQVLPPVPRIPATFTARASSELLLLLFPLHSLQQSPGQVRLSKPPSLRISHAPRLHRRSRLRLLTRLLQRDDFTRSFQKGTFAFMFLLLFGVGVMVSFVVVFASDFGKGEAKTPGEIGRSIDLRLKPESVSGGEFPSNCLLKAEDASCG